MLSTVQLAPSARGSIYAPRRPRAECVGARRAWLLAGSEAVVGRSAALLHKKESAAHPLVPVRATAGLAT